MSTVSEIIEAVKKLPERDKSEFLERLGEVDFDDAWIVRLRPTKAGRLDDLWAEAMEDIKAGRTKPLDEVLRDE